MKWEHEIVPNLTLCKKLKRAGYPQAKAGCFWIKEANKWIIREVQGNIKAFLREFEEAMEVVKAPTIAELLKSLPTSIRDKRGMRGFLTIEAPGPKVWIVSYDFVIEDPGEYPYALKGSVSAVSDRNLPNALAKMYLALKEAGNEN